jgi:hypothetical protein
MKDLSKEYIRGSIQTEWRLRNINKITIKKIASKYNVSVSTVRRWKNRTTPLLIKRIRKSKMNAKIKKFMVKYAGNKIRASSRSIASKIRRRFRLDVCHTTVNKWLNLTLFRPRRIREAFRLSIENMGSRRFFCDYLMENNIKGEEIFFNDEKIFNLESPLNPQINRVRHTKKCNKDYKS